MDSALVDRTSFEYLDQWKRLVSTTIWEKGKFICDWRDALHEFGPSFTYVSKLARVTAGLRLELGNNLVVKAEYTLDRELGRLPQIPNDVFTTAIVAKF